MAIFLSLLLFLFFVAALLGLLMPKKLGFFLKQPTRGKTFASYMAALLLVGVVAGAMAPKAPQTPVPPVAAPVAIADEPTTEPDSPAVTALKADYRVLWNELQGFRNDKKFYEVGFSKSGPYSNWMDRATAVGEKYPGPVQLQSGLIFGELRQLALDYMRSKGAQTEYIRSMEAEIKKALQ